MKKIIMLVAVLLLVATGVIIFYNKKGISAVIGGDSKQIELTYTINGGTPYKWEFEIEDESIVSFVKSYVLEDNNKDGVVGASISTNYVFKGLKEGKTTVTFKLLDLTKADSPAIKKEELKLRVDKDLNIALNAM